MDANRHTAGDEPDEEVFGPVEDGEEVFEWIDDADVEQDLETAADRQPSPTFRERVAALRAGGESLRRSRRQIAAVVAAVVLAGAVGGGFTAWFDSVAAAADRASVVSLAVDSIVDGDPQAVTYDAKQTSATGQYVVEFANNSPDPVTLTSVTFDAGFMGTATGWKPVGDSARIPGGGTGKVALTVRLFCPMVLRITQGGYYGSVDAMAISFPPLHVGVLDGNGDVREMVLPTRASVSTKARDETGQSTFLDSGISPTPRIVSADGGICGQWETDREGLLTSDAGRVQDRKTNGLVFSYDRLVQPIKDRSFTIGVTVRNTTDHALTVITRSEPFIQNQQIKSTWLPSHLDLAAGQSASAQVKVTTQDCGGWMTDPLSLTMLEIHDPSTDASMIVFPDRSLTGSVRLANDVARQMAACQ